MACTYNAIYYGGLTLTGFPVSTINSEMVRDDGGNVVKYIRNTLEVELIISLETCRIDAGLALGTIDADMDYIRQVLSCPNKSFSIAYRGAGRGPTENQYDSEFSADLTVLPNDAGVWRSDNLNTMGLGVFPEVLTWEPLAGSKAAKVRWRCTFFTSKTGPLSLKYSAVESALRTYSSPYTLPSDYNNGTDARSGEVIEPAAAAWDHTSGGKQFDWKVLIISFTEEQEVDINEEGMLTLTSKGVIEFSHEGVQTELQHWANPSDPGNADWTEEWLIEPKNRRAIAQDIARMFEPYLPRGFTRKHKFTYDKTHRKLEYVIVDTEQIKASAKFPRIVSWEATHKVGSTIGTSDSAFSPQGFYSWENVFSGTFVVAPGYWKGWAWVAMLVLIKQRIECTVSIIGDPQLLKDDIDAATTEPSQVAAQKDRKVLVPKHIMTDVSIVDHMHNNRVDVSIRYIVMTSLSKLFTNTGLFNNVYSLWTTATANESGRIGSRSNILADGVTPPAVGTPAVVPHPSTWIPREVTVIEEINKFYHGLSANAVGYRGLGLSNYNVIFDPDNLNLPTDPASYANTTFPVPPGIGVPLQDENGNAFSPWTPPASMTNRQNSEVFAAHRREEHYVESPYNPDVRERDKPANAPQKPEDAAGSPPKTSGVSYPGSDSAQASWMKDLDPSHSWVEYSPDFELIEVSNSSYVPTIQAAPLSVVQGSYNPANTAENMTRGVTKFTINNNNTAYGASSNQPNATRYSDHAVIAHGKPTYYIKFTGSATRVGYPIPMPVVGGLMNQASDGSIGTVLSVYRVGKQHWRHKQIAQSADMPVFEAEWDITYAIYGDPTCGNISFIHSRQSEFA